MGDCTSYSVQFDRTGITDKALDNITADLELDSWDVLTARVDGVWRETGTVNITSYGHSVGEADTIAACLVEWMRRKPKRLRAFSVLEDGMNDWNGTKHVYDPARSVETWETYEVDNGGNIIVGASDVARMIARAEGSFEALVLALGAAFGSEVDEVVNVETAKHRDAAKEA